MNGKLTSSGNSPPPALLVHGRRLLRACGRDEGQCVGKHARRGRRCVSFYSLPHQTVVQGARMAREGVSGAAPARAELEFALCKESRRDTCLGTHVPGCPLPILPTLTPFALAAGR